MKPETRRLSWLRRRWLRLTVPAGKRCSRCLRRGDWGLTQTEKRGTLRIETTTRYCKQCFDLAWAETREGGSDGQS